MKITLKDLEKSNTLAEILEEYKYEFVTREYAATDFVKDTLEKIAKEINE